MVPFSLDFKADMDFKVTAEIYLSDQKILWTSFLSNFGRRLTAYSFEAP